MADDGLTEAVLDTLPWTERLRLQRVLAEDHERFWPRWMEDGVTLSQPGGPSVLIGASAASLTLGEYEAHLTVVSVGREGAAIPVSDAPPTISGIEVRRQIAPTITEWWRALPSGLEHGITLAERPAGDGALVIDLTIDGLNPRSLSQSGVALVTSDGARVGTYAHLLVTDADGARMPARMSVVGGAVRIEVDDAGGRYPLVVDPLVAMEEATLLVSDVALGYDFGTSVALTFDGSRALVGAPFYSNSGGREAGSARVFVRSGTSWTEEATLLASGAAARDNFGCSVALASDGSRALVGARWDDTAAGREAGSARVFVRSGTSWVEEATLLASGAAAGDFFGWAVALTSDGTRALVGAIQDDTAAADAGSARVFVRTGTSWMEEATLLASGARAEDGFGASVALSSDGSRAIMGAFFDDTVGGVDAGSARVFVRSGSSWTEEATLLASGAAAGDFFGWSIALSPDGGRALVGVPRDDTAGGMNAGSVRVFVRGGTSWLEETTLLASGGMAGDSLGISVALASDGNTALLGAPYDDTPGGPNAGSASVFVRGGTSWTAEAILFASGAEARDEFGFAVALVSDGSLALVGARQDGTALGATAGSARVFTLGPPAVNGTACSSSSHCASGFCTDAVCCESACGRSASEDCQACSITAGGSADGTCTPLTAAVAPTVVCRPSISACDPIGEICSSSSITCPSDVGAAPAGTECRASAGTCDMAETCTGSSTACPADAFAASTTECRASVGVCDVAEACSGSSTVCPVDAFAASTTECRASVGVCDVVENCTGRDVACPADAVADGTSCADSDACNGDEVCVSGVCMGAIVDCDDGNPCTADACDATSGCRNTVIDGCCRAALDCEDADPCTTDTCSGSGGSCTNAPIAGCGVDASTPSDAGVREDAGSRASDAGGHEVDGGTDPAESGCACRATGALGRDGRGLLFWHVALLLVVLRRLR